MKLSANVGCTHCHLEFHTDVMIVDGDGTATRTGTRKDEEGKNVRISRRSGKDL